MLDACASGDVVALQRLFKASNIVNGSKPVYISSDEVPPTNDLLEVAIKNGHQGILSLVLTTDKKIQLSGQVITALVNCPNVNILRKPYNHDNLIVQFEWHDQQSTFVTEACKRLPEKITPLLHFLIESDAALDVGGFRFRFAVWAAISGNQRLDVIEAMMKKGGPVTNAAIRQAVICERLDVIDAFVRFGIEGESDDMQFLRTMAEEIGNLDVMELVYAWNGNWGTNSVGGLNVVQKIKRMFRGKR